MKKLDDFIVQHKFSKNVKSYGLLLSYDEKKHLILNIGNEDGCVLIRKFNGKHEMDKFLAEAVILRMSVHNKDIKEVRKCYNNLISFLNDEDRVSENALL